MICLIKWKEKIRSSSLVLICKIVWLPRIVSGVGANCIYPLLGICKYGWKFAGSDVNKESIEWAQETIIRKNKVLLDSFIDLGGSIRLQKDSASVLEEVIYEGEQFDFTMCNPPFFNSEEERKHRKSSVRETLPYL